MMRIGIMVHSATGNTLSVAERLRDSLVAAGHEVVVERVVARNDLEVKVAKIQLLQTPGVSTYDVLIFAAPVRAFSLSAVMRAYMAKVESLKGKRVAFFVTQFLPYSWMGGERALKQALEICRTKGGEPCGTGVINWMSAVKRERQIRQLLDRFSTLITK